LSEGGDGSDDLSRVPSDKDADQSLGEAKDVAKIEDPSLAPSKKAASEVLDSAEGVAKLEDRSVETRKRAIDNEKSGVDLTLQKWIGYGGPALMFIQLVIANLVFVKYAHEKGWGSIPTGVIQVYLAATVVQVIGVVLIIARSVFPEGGRNGPAA